MGQFKPMVKMETTEPSVILKLKKGGQVAHKMGGGYMPMATPQPMPAGLPARGGATPSAAPMKPSMAARRRAMTAKKPSMMASKPAMNPTMMKDGGMADCGDVKEDLMKHKAMPVGKAHKKASGGKVAKFVNTGMKTADKTTKTGSTGDVKKGNAGGYAAGGTISGNAGKFANTKMGTAKATKTGSTGGVKMGNAGGFATGGKVNDCWENKPADTAKPGKTGTTTGGVRKGNAGGFMEGGSAKKAYATGGKVDSGKAQAMPKKPASRPVANNMQSGTFAKGGKVGKYADGDLVDASKGAYDKSIGPSESEMDMAKAIRSAPRKLLEGAKSMMGMGKPAPKAGSITKTEKSVTVAPKKGGGGC